MGFKAFKSFLCQYFFFFLLLLLAEDTLLVEKKFLLVEIHIKIFLNSNISNPSKTPTNTGDLNCPRSEDWVRSSMWNVDPHRLYKDQVTQNLTYVDPDPDQ